jgi:predicted nuclease with TOPRIM domain
VAAGDLIAEYSTHIVALAGTLFGGVGLAITQRWLDRAKIKDDSAKEIRDELRVDVATHRAEVNELKKELDKVEGELSTWRNRYFDLRSQYVTLKGLYEDAIRQIQAKTVETVEDAKHIGIELPPVPEIPVDEATKQAETGS